MVAFSFGTEPGGSQKLLGGGRYSEVHHIGNDMGKCLGLKVNGRYSEVAAIRGFDCIIADVGTRGGTCSAPIAAYRVALFCSRRHPDYMWPLLSECL